MVLVIASEYLNGSSFNRHPGTPFPIQARRALFSVSWRELYKNDAVAAAALFAPYSDHERAMLDVQSSPASSRAQLPFRAVDIDRGNN